MKHIRLFENISVSSVRKMIIDYTNFLKDIKPIIVEKYKELADDRGYETEYGDQPHKHNINDLVLTSIGYWDQGVQFVLTTYDNDGGLQNHYYINVTNDELEDMLIKLTSNKYNL